MSATGEPVAAGMRASLRSPSVGLRVLIVFSAVAIGAGLGRALVTTYLPVLLERIRDAPGLIGVVMLVNTAAGFVVPLVVGAWSDRLRLRGHGRTLPVVLGGTLLAAGGLVAIALGATSSYLALALFAAITYVGLNAVTTGHRALIPQTFDEDGRAPATAGEELAMLAGTLAGVVAGGFLIEVEPWAPFALGAVLLPLLALPTVLRMRGREQPLATPPATRPGLAAYREAVMRPGARLVLVAQGLWVLGYVGLPPFFVLYAERVLDLSPSRSALLLAGFGILTGVAMLAAGTVRPAAQRAWLVAGAAAMGTGMLVVAMGSSVAAVAPPLVPVAVGYGVVSTLGFPVFTRFIAAGEEGTGSALYFSVRSVSSAVALPVAGWTIELTGSYRALFVLGGAVTLAAVVPLLRLGSLRPPPVLRVALVRAAMLTTLTLVLLGAAATVHATELFRIDESLFDALEGFGGVGKLTDELVVDPHLRNYTLLTLLCTVVAWRHGRGHAGRTALVVFGAGMAAYAAVRLSWALWDRPRPEEVLGTEPANQHAWRNYPSFPSGHMAVSTAIGLAGSMMVPVLRPLLWAFVFIIGWTRVSYGAHFPSDVLAGLAIGLASAVLVVTPAERSLLPHLRRPRKRDLQRWARLSGIVAVAVSVVALLGGHVPVAPEGGILDPEIEYDLQVALIVAAGVLAAAAWWWDPLGAPLLLVGGAVAVFSAVEYSPGLSVIAFAVFAVPAVLHLLAWDRVHRSTDVLAIAVLTVGVAAGVSALAVSAHDKVYGPSHPQSDTPAVGSDIVRWAWTGGVTPTSVTVTARLRGDGVARLVVTQPQGRASSVVSDGRRVTHDSDHFATMQVTGLRPDTTYRWHVTLDGSTDDGASGTVRTFPAGRAPVTIAVGACARTRSNGRVFDAIRAQRPDLMLFSGDFFYANIENGSRRRFIEAYEHQVSQPAQSALYRTTPIAYVWDDHDFGGNGSDGTSPSRDEARRTYDDAVPHYPLAMGPDAPINQSFRIGRVRVLMLDTRSARSPASAPDDARKTMLGRRQKAWLKRELLRSRDADALTVLVSGVPWVGDRETGGDSWAGYATERRELSSFVAEHDLRRIVMLAGDAHMVAIDDGSNTDYSGTGRAGFPLLHAAALDRTGHTKGGPYSEGAFPGGGQFGTLRVDDHGDRLDIELAGRRYDGRVLVRHAFTVRVPAGR